MDIQAESFWRIKETIVKSPALAFYDPGKELTLEYDASEYGLGSALIQCGKPVTFASRALSRVERNYTQI